MYLYYNPKGLRSSMNLKQKIILRKLVESNGLRYSDLSETFEAEDRFIHHLRQLLKQNFIYKKENKYYLTADGLKYSKNFDEKSLKEHDHIDVLLAFICKYKDQFYLEKDYPKNDVDKSWYRLARGVPQFGENFIECAQRILKEKLRITVPVKDIQYANVFHRQTKSSDNIILFDDLVTLFTIEINDKNYLKNKRNHKYQKWFSVEEIKVLDNILPEIEKFILSNETPIISEFVYENNYNLDY